MFPLSFATLIANKWVQRAAMVAGVLAALWVCAQYFEHKGVVQGRQDSAQQVADAIEVQRKSELAAMKEKVAEAKADADAADARSQSDRQLFAQLTAQRSAVTSQVNSLSVADVTAAVRKEIGDLSLPEVQRQILECHQQLPLCEKQVVSAQAEASDNLASAKAWHSAFDDSDHFVDQLTQDYVSLWNVKAVPVKSWKCLKLWRCSTPKIKSPDPATLKKPSVQAPAATAVNTGGVSNRPIAS